MDDPRQIEYYMKGLFEDEHDDTPDISDEDRREIDALFEDRKPLVHITFWVVFILSLMWLATITILIDLGVSPWVSLILLVPTFKTFRLLWNEVRRRRF